MARTEAPRGTVAVIAIVVVSSLIWFFFVKTVPPGRVGVATLFGSVVPEGYTQGIHVPVNPLYSWTMFDAREKTHLETANVPSQDYLQPKGITVTAVLIRDITLPPFIVEAIERKKEREQAVERERAELERVRTELQQQVARAEAGRQASEEEAARKRILADAQAYEITQINNAIAKNPAYIQLQSLEALKAISKDPASKMYFMDGSSPNPLPLLHLGDTQTLQR